MDRIHTEIRSIEDYTLEDLLVYFGEISVPKFGPGNKQLLDKADTENILELLEQRGGAKKRNLYLLIQSSGGHISEAMKIVEALRENYTNIHVVNMTSAGSAATYLSLCGDTLYMDGRALLSDFGPQNWNDGPLLSADDAEQRSKMLGVLYSTMTGQLSAGVMKGQLEKVRSVIMNLGGPCISGRSPEGRIHGTPIMYVNITSLITENIKPLFDIPAPGNPVHSVAANLQKLTKAVRRKMSRDKLAKIIAYGGHHVTTPVE